ncbi:hypothetical protein CSKR_113331 [Clonorchis sinensis]|uniref:Reverse transcriptase domain-containing protein n=1 Tax=Clonorchis sinensis TaxID=79923 RepID=A0A8T1MI57_CLOSI|nr:hypothetical protein CSKR_113331 [Clonorchis sinensis]
MDAGGNEDVLSGRVLGVKSTQYPAIPGLETQFAIIHPTWAKKPPDSQSHKLSKFLYDRLPVNRRLTEDELGTNRSLPRYEKSLCEVRQSMTDEFGKILTLGIYTTAAGSVDRICWFRKEGGIIVHAAVKLFRNPIQEKTNGETRFPQNFPPSSWRRHTKELAANGWYIFRLQKHSFESYTSHSLRDSREDSTLDPAAPVRQNITSKCGLDLLLSGPVSMGVAQGSVLGLLLFLINVGDLAAVRASPCLLFTEDLKSSRSYANDLQMDIDAARQWLLDWHLPLNSEKCIHISFRLLPHIESLKDIAAPFFHLGLSVERQPVNDKNKTDPGNSGESLKLACQSVNPCIRCP